MFISITSSTYVFCKTCKHVILHNISIRIIIYQRENWKTRGVHPDYTDLDPDDDLCDCRFRTSSWPDPRKSKEPPCRVNRKRGLSWWEGTTCWRVSSTSTSHVTTMGRPPVATWPSYTPTRTSTRTRSQGWRNASTICRWQLVYENSSHHLQLLMWAFSAKLSSLSSQYL